MDLNVKFDQIFRGFAHRLHTGKGLGAPPRPNSMTPPL